MLIGSFALLVPVTRAANPTVTTSVINMHHHGDRVVNSLMRSTASRVIGSLPLGHEFGGGSARGDLVVRDFGVVLDGVARQLHERLFQRAALRRELVQDDEAVIDRKSTRLNSSH